MLFQSAACALRFLPAFVVGMPVAVDIFLFALLIPVARFQLKPPKAIFFFSLLFLTATRRLDARKIMLSNLLSESTDSKKILPFSAFVTKFSVEIWSTSHVDQIECLYYNSNHIGYGEERDLQMKQEIRKPNLMRVALELSTYQNPYKAANALLSLVEGSLDDSANSNQNFGLLRGDVIVFPDKS